LRDVSVYSPTDEKEVLYTVDAMYLSRNREDLSIEVLTAEKLTKSEKPTLEEEKT
jgi:hypothetical protein